MGHAKPSDETKGAIASMYLAGYSLSVVAAKFGYKSHVSVLKILRQLGVETRTQSEGMTGLANARKHSLNEHLFDGEIDTEEKAYLLGLMYSDGWVTTAQGGKYVMGIGSTDREIVEMVKSILSATNPIVAKKVYSDAHRQGYEFVASSKSLVTGLRHHGCVENKSHILTYPTLKEGMHRHFIRGLWDGDGSVKNTIPSSKHRSKYLRLSLVGAMDLLYGVMLHMDYALGCKGAFSNHGNVFRLVYSSRAKDVHDYIYKDAKYALARKATLSNTEHPAPAQEVLHVPV